jgi:hypothetical protein
MNRKVLLAAAAVAISAVVLVTALLVIRPQSAPATFKNWYFVDSMSGNGDYQSSAFSMSDEWRVKWNYSGNVFGVFVYKQSTIDWNPVVGADSLQTNATSGILNVTQTGTVKIEVIASDVCSWHLTIEAYY